MRDGDKKNYQNLFFLCPLRINKEQLVQEEDDFNAQEEERVRRERHRLDYLCLEAKDPGEGECTNPTYDTPTLCREGGGQWTYYCRVGECSVNTRQSRTFCEGVGETWQEYLPGDENGTEEAKEAIQRRVEERCGCRGSDCEGFGLTAEKNTAGEIVSVACKFPEVEGDPLIQYLGVELSGRSVPHRFFKASDGEGVDSLSDLKTLIPSEQIPEGDRFYYLDPVSKIAPQGNYFNMNAILGELSSNAFGAQPAKMLAVESGQAYIIRTISGIYTPCPGCPGDPWQSSFTPYPPSRNGVGLQAAGYIHNRSEHQDNIHRGNYGDTLFGRACWVPPTMLPFSHQKRGDISEQRLSRLRTQSALYVNGYKRDWFGFNLGAVIGSFDGVKWFAVGSGRRVLATSNKLFLAVNAPFGDLSTPVNLVVDVVPDQGAGEAVTSHDYDISLEPDHLEQNLGGSCQRWHQCKVDSDCVTQLGWEYMCADVNSYLTRWPRFDINGKEKVDEEKKAGFLQILQERLPVGEKKRCVYRGAGALCKRDVNNDLAEKKKKLFQCAPNFYCAHLRSNNFNRGLVRTLESFQDPIFFGQESNVLGRPERYVGAGDILENDIVSNLEYNFSLHTSATNDVGICRPGKELHPTDLTAQHSNKDPGERTDHINQISSCDSSALGAFANNRIATCPIFQTEEEAEEEVGDYITDRIDWNEGHLQNRCGGDIQRDNGAGVYENSFRGLELERLRTVFGINQPSLVKDACSRRAGAVCFTDLDCSPNYLHSDLVDYLGEEAFGNTRAEMLYWSEPLVCGQAHEPPQLTSEDYYDYDITKNRCCRPVGEELTMFTQDDDGIIDDNVERDSGVLDTGYFPFLFDPANAEGFYSRYVSSASERRSGFQGVPYAEVPEVNENRVPKSFQWKSLADTGEKTCCGGTWIRKFVDDSNDWSNTTRIQMDPAHFTCLNYQSDIYREHLSFGDIDNYIKNANWLCRAPGDNGCIQTKFRPPAGFDIRPPEELAGGVETLDTTPEDGPASEGLLVRNKNFAVPYLPVEYVNPTPVDAEDSNGPYNYFPRQDWPAITVYFPTYIGGTQNIRRVGGQRDIRITYYDSDGSTMGAPVLLSQDTVNCAAATASNARVLNQNSYCVTNDPSGRHQIIHVRAHDTLPTDWARAGVQIRFNIPGSNAFCWGTGGGDPNCPEGGQTVGSGIRDPDQPGGGGINANYNGMRAGNELYYLTKLGRLELLGIPQIWYEPLYCNSNRHRLVEGIFDLPTAHQNYNGFTGAGSYDPFAFPYDGSVNGRDLNSLYDETPPTRDIANPTGHVTLQDKVVIPPVFSGNKFLCCLGLGETTPNASRCCSGYAKEEEKEEGEKTSTCLLPSGTNLHVYFNSFVSNEGRGDDQPGGGLVDDDFIPETGEPKNVQPVYDKLTALGEVYCQEGTLRQGAAFGEFSAEPNEGFFHHHNTSEEGRYYSIVDSPKDKDDNENGYTDFVKGFRWNHHIYCR